MLKEGLSFTVRDLCVISRKLSCRYQSEKCEFMSNVFQYFIYWSITEYLTHNIYRCYYQTVEHSKYISKVSLKLIKLNFCNIIYIYVHNILIYIQNYIIEKVSQFVFL